MIAAKQNNSEPKSGEHLIKEAGTVKAPKNVCYWLDYFKNYIEQSATSILWNPK